MTREIKEYGTYIHPMECITGKDSSGQTVQRYLITARLSHVSSSLSSSYQKIKWCAVRWKVQAFELFDWKQMTPSTCLEQTNGMRTLRAHEATGLARGMGQTFAIRILSMLMLRDE